MYFPAACFTISEAQCIISRQHVLHDMLNNAESVCSFHMVRSTARFEAQICKRYLRKKHCLSARMQPSSCPGASKMGPFNFQRIPFPVSCKVTCHTHCFRKFQSFLNIRCPMYSHCSIMKMVHADNFSRI